jgi:septum formation protein
MQLVLASQSPRRRELLLSVGAAFEVEAAGIDEDVRPGEQPTAYVERLAREKAACVAARRPDGFVLAADTTVSLDGRIFGKPADAVEAHAMLAALAGHMHLVTTGYALCVPGGLVVSDTVATAVSMRPLSPDEIAWYVATGEPFDKAGGYAIQGRAAHFITRIDGSVTNVIGLPLSEVVLLLRTHGFPVALRGAA